MGISIWFVAFNKFFSKAISNTISENNLKDFSTILKKAVKYFEKNKINTAHKALFSEKLLLDETSYFFDTKTAVNQRLYLMISESTRRGDSFERHHIIFFEDQIFPFINGFDRASQFLTS